MSEILTTGSSINLQMLILPLFLKVTFQKHRVFSVRRQRNGEGNLPRQDECSSIWKSEPLMPEACLGKDVFEVPENLKQQVIRICSPGDQNTRTVQAHLFNVFKIP